MRILIVTDRDCSVYSGFTSRLAQEIRYFAGKGFDMGLLCVGQNTLPNEQIKDQITFYGNIEEVKKDVIGAAMERLSLIPPRIRYLRDQRYAEGALKYIQHFDPDWVFCETINPLELCLRLVPPEKVICNIHDNEALRLKSLLGAENNLIKRMYKAYTSYRYYLYQRQLHDLPCRHWTFVSEPDYLGHSLHGTVTYIPITVENRYFEIPLKRSSDSNEVLFVGNADYIANVEGLKWFLREVWPGILYDQPNTLLRVVGRGWELPPSLNVKYEGYVDDLLNEYESVRVVIAPVRLGGGMKVKVVEAMSAGCCVVGTRESASGINDGIVIADNASEMRGLLLEALRNEPFCITHQEKARAYAVNRFSQAAWDSLLQTVSSM